MKLTKFLRPAVAGACALIGGSLLFASAANAQTRLSSKSTGNNDGFYYTFWQESGNDASKTLLWQWPLYVPVEQWWRRSKLGGRARLEPRRP